MRGRGRSYEPPRSHAVVDPVYLAVSFTLYYVLVDRIVLSVDAAGLSWGGGPMDVDECARQARLADPAGKIDVQPGSFSHPETHHGVRNQPASNGLNLGHRKVPTGSSNSIPMKLCQISTHLPAPWREPTAQVQWDATFQLGGFPPRPTRLLGELFQVLETSQ